MAATERMLAKSLSMERNWAPLPAKARLRNSRSLYQSTSLFMSGANASPIGRSHQQHKGGFLVRSRLSIRFLIFLIAALFLLVATMMTLTAAQQGRGRG